MLLWCLLGLALALSAATWWVQSWPAFGAAPAGERLARVQASPQWRDGAFADMHPPAPYTAGYVAELLAGQFGGEPRAPRGTIPVLPVRAAEITAPRPAPGLRAFWIGHASLFIELDGVRLLVDPVFGEFASPLPLGPRRFHPPPIPLAELPSIDAVLITHDHYDHLDMASVQHLARAGSAFYVPLGVGAHLQRWGVPAAQVHELDWGDEARVRGIRVLSTPARHYSGRGLGDRNATLWGSWVAIGMRHRVFVSGDTGYDEHFRAIGGRYGPFDIAFVKIGAYGPGAPWLDIHMSAEDAMRAGRELRARWVFPEHWATFNLAFHAWAEPIRRALAAAQAESVTLLTPRIGQWIDADRPRPPFDPWWEVVP